MLECYPTVLLGAQKKIKSLEPPPLPKYERGSLYWWILLADEIV